MTCIVGIETGDHVVIGGDSAGVAGYGLTVRADEKVWARDGFAFGFTSSFRMGQLLRYKLRLPPSRLEVKASDDAGCYRWMVTDFVDAVRACLKEGGYLKTDSGEEKGGTFLVGWHGRLYAIHGDLQVGRAMAGYCGVGCGGEIAEGALYATKGEQPDYRVREALRAAAYHSAGVCKPFHIVDTAEGQDA